jgi:FkbM family methyltransferase
MKSADYVTLLYEALLGRNPDGEGLRHHVDVLETTGDLRVIVDKIVGSEEYINKHAPLSTFVLPDFVAMLDRPFTIVDVGAQKLDGENHIYSPIISSGINWKCIGFEPLEHRRVERINAEADKRLVIIDAFIGDGLRHIFRVVSDDGSSSLLALNHDFNASYEHIAALQTVHEEEVGTQRLDDILSGEPVIDFLKFDIQGFEDRALKSARNTLARTNVVHIESFFGPMYNDQAFFSDIDSYLRDAGFEFVDFSTLRRYRYIAVPHPSTMGERLIWADAVYIRTLDPRREPASSFVAQAAAASLIYEKHGLAQDLLCRGGLASGG